MSEVIIVSSRLSGLAVVLTLAFVWLARLPCLYVFGAVSLLLAMALFTRLCQ